MDDPRSVLEFIYFSMFMRKFMRTFLFRIAHCDPEEPSTKICTTPCLGIMVGPLTLISFTLFQTLRMTPGGESSVNLGMPCEAL